MSVAPVALLGPVWRVIASSDATEARIASMHGAQRHIQPTVTQPQ